MKENNLEFYTVNEFAKKIKAHPNTVRSAIKCGRIQAFRIGRGVKSAFRILKSELKRIQEFDAGEIVEKIVKDRGGK